MTADELSGARSQPRHPNLPAVGLMLFLLLPLGCGAPRPGSPEAAYDETIQALQSGDQARIFEILDSGFTRELADLIDLIDEVRDLLIEIYPAEQHAAALEAAAGSLAVATTPLELFSLLARERDEGPLSFMAKLGSRASGAEIDGDTAIVTTRAGDRWRFFRAQDGAWRFSPPKDDRAVIREARERARSVVAALEKHRRVLEQLKGEGVVRPAPAPDERVAPDEEIADDTENEAVDPVTSPK